MGTSLWLKVFNGNNWYVWFVPPWLDVNWCWIWIFHCWCVWCNWYLLSLFIVRDYLKCQYVFGHCMFSDFLNVYKINIFWYCMDRIIFSKYVQFVMTVCIMYLDNMFFVLYFLYSWEFNYFLNTCSHCGNDRFRSLFVPNAASFINLITTYVRCFSGSYFTLN